MSETDVISGPYYLIDKYMVRETVSKKLNGKFSRPSRLVSVKIDKINR